MKIIGWKTGHNIADTIIKEFGYDICDYFCNAFDFAGRINLDADVHIGYGILRGMAEIYNKADNWFEIDNGYWGAGHFSGNYRISFKSTQSQYSDDLQQPHGLILGPWKTTGDTILIVPPSDYVREFFNVTGIDWYRSNFNPYLHKCVVRTKDAKELINWEKIKGVITFNSTVGVEALRRGIPVISDIEHSMIGSYYKQKLIDKGLDYTFENVMTISREPLFNCMQTHQFTLEDIREGKAWKLLNYYLRLMSGSDTIPVKQLLQK
jgi:hypothetical protein